MEANLLSRILTGEATLEEKKEFYDTLKDNQEEEQLFYEVKSLWIRASLQKTIVNPDAEFDQLWKKIKQTERPVAFAIGKRILRYAAIILVTLSLGGLSGYFLVKDHYEQNNAGTQTYTAMKGNVSIIEFSDGTKIWLNSDSRLTYHEDLKGKQRLAELTGEAYFEVKHRDDFPFKVQVGQLVIRDLGTTFNIKAYPEDRYVETSLVEGEVDILTKKGNPLVVLKPGESVLYFPEEKKIELRSVSNNVLSAWRDGKFVIRDQRLEDIFKELSRWYNVRFSFEKQDLRDYRFTGNIKKSTTVQHVLKMLKLTTDFNYRIIEKPAGPDEIVVY
jgi:ferric-dicitrate binding protein FerR (iron transport regulator)